MCFLVPDTHVVRYTLIQIHGPLVGLGGKWCRHNHRQSIGDVQRFQWVNFRSYGCSRFHQIRRSNAAQLGFDIAGIGREVAAGCTHTNQSIAWKVRVLHSSVKRRLVVGHVVAAKSQRLLLPGVIAGGVAVAGRCHVAGENHFYKSFR